MLFGWLVRLSDHLTVVPDLTISNLAAARPGPAVFSTSNLVTAGIRFGENLLWEQYT